MDLSSGILTLSWTDTFASGGGYQIEQQVSGAWTTLEALPSQGSQNELKWARAVNAATAFRVEASLASYKVPLKTSSLQEQLLVAPPSTLPSILLDQTEPVSGDVGVSIDGGGTYTSVNYFFDLKALASSTNAPDYAVTMHTNRVTAGSHLLLADLQTSPDSYLEIRRSVQVANPQIALQLSSIASQHLDFTATSDFGIQTVTAAVDGVSLGSLSAPNASGNEYSFTVAPSQGTSGHHTVTAQATDNNGETTSLTQDVTFDNPPTLTVASPFDGMLVNGTLHLSGTFATDKTSGVTLNAALGDAPILLTTASPFSSDYSLAGVSPGNYTLTVTAKDGNAQSTTVSKTITVTSAASLVYSPELTLGIGGQLLRVENETLLYRLADGSVHLRSGSTDTVLETGVLYPTQWQLGGGHVFALGAGATSGSVDVYHWAPTVAAPQNLGALGPSGLLARIRAVHWPWVLASDGIPNNQVSGFSPAYLFYNAMTGQILSPSLTNASLGFQDVDFNVTPGGLALYYGADLSANPGFNPIGISRWDQGTGQSTPIAIGNSWQINQQTDGMRLAWQAGPPGQSAPFNLVVLDIASASQQTLSTRLSQSPTSQPPSGQFQLAGGLLAWRETDATSAAIKVSDGTTVTTVSSRLSSSLYGTGSGYVLFGEDSKLYVWNAAAGKQLVLDVPPGIARISGKTIYFTNGVNQTLYSRTLP